MIIEATKKLVTNQNLTYDDASQVMDEMMSGKATDAQMAAFFNRFKSQG